MPTSEDSTDDFFANYDPRMEALQEISNIGVGHAATALSQLLNRRIDMSIPRINFVPIEDAAGKLAESPDEVVAGTLVDAIEENGSRIGLVVIFDKNSVFDLLRILREQNPLADLNELDEIGRSIIEETSNILLLHTISAINSFTESFWFPQSPQLVIDMVGSLTDELLVRDIDIDKNMRALLVECDVFTEDVKLKGNILLLPNKEGLSILMERVYGEGWEDMF